MNRRKLGEQCVLHRYHFPLPMRLVKHHVDPVYLGGARNGRLALVCDTGHYAVHEVLDELVAVGPVALLAVTAHRSEKKMAKLAYDTWLARGEPKPLSMERPWLV